MTLDWILAKLRENTDEAAKEVLNALENATADDINKLGVNAIGWSMGMKICGVDKFGNTPIKEEQEEVNVNDRDC